LHFLNGIYIIKYGQEIIDDGALAQLGERRAGSAKVTGSNPVCSIQKALAMQGFFLFYPEGIVRFKADILKKGRSLTICPSLFRYTPPIPMK
jgi:hypothetical protein